MREVHGKKSLYRAMFETLIHTITHNFIYVHTKYNLKRRSNKECCKHVDMPSLWAQ